MKTTTNYTKIICIYASFVLCSAAAQSTNLTVRDCQDLQNTTIICTGCLNNTLGLKCKYLLQEGTPGSCKNLDAPLETNSTAVTSIGDCGDPFLGTDANGTVVANNTPKLTNVSESTVTPPNPPLTNDTTLIPPTTTVTDVPTEAPVTDTPTPTTTTPATTTTAATEPSTTTTTVTTTAAPTTTESTTTPIPTTNTTTTETTTAPTTPATSTTPSGNVTTEAPTTPTTINPSPAPASRGFDSASFFGGIVLVLGLFGIGYFGVRIYRQRVDRSYHTL